MRDFVVESQNASGTWNHARGRRIRAVNGSAACQEFVRQHNPETGKYLLRVSDSEKGLLGCIAVDWVHEDFFPKCKPPCVAAGHHACQLSFDFWRNDV